MVFFHYPSINSSFYHHSPEKMNIVSIIAYISAVIFLIAVNVFTYFLYTRYSKNRRLGKLSWALCTCVEIIFIIYGEIKFGLFQI